jgi:protein-L-isoaspartate(D-aspartate) O-methyltransferase
MHAYALEYLKDYIKEGSKVLDVGSGSGYLYFNIYFLIRTLAFSKMMNDKGLVVGIEHISQLYQLGIKNISKSHLNLLDSGKIEILEGDGRLGYINKSPYDCIHVGAAAECIPEDLILQLAPGGRMMIPVGPQHDMQYIYLIDKDYEGNINKQKLLCVRYVPLTSKDLQLNEN